MEASGLFTLLDGMLLGFDRGRSDSRPFASTTTDCESAMCLSNYPNDIILFFIILMDREKLRVERRARKKLKKHQRKHKVISKNSSGAHDLELTHVYSVMIDAYTVFIRTLLIPGGR